MLRTWRQEHPHQFWDSQPNQISELKAQKPDLNILTHTCARTQSKGSIKLKEKKSSPYQALTTQLFSYFLFHVFIKILLCHLMFCILTSPIIIITYFEGLSWLCNFLPFPYSISHLHRNITFGWQQPGILSTTPMNPDSLASNFASNRHEPHEPECGFQYLQNKSNIVSCFLGMWCWVSNDELWHLAWPG